MSEKKIVKIFVFRCNHAIKWCDSHLFLYENYDYRNQEKVLNIALKG